MNYQPEDLVKSCRKLESGLRLGQEGIHACQLGPFCAPLYWSADEASQTKITKEIIVKKRQALFQQLNDRQSDIACKHCHMVRTKRYEDVNFTRLGHVDLAATTTCNLRCSFCGYTVHNSFSKSRYDALSILKEFTADDVEWDSAVDFNGGEPSLLHDLDEYLDYFNSRRIRVFLYTNGVKFRQSIYDGLVNGSIRWVCTSLDAGSPSSFLRLKKSDHFLLVVENLTRYASAGRKGGGKLSVKYIFCDDNCSEDDIAGFTYSMLAIRPQKIWLTFDFEPLQSLLGDSLDLGKHDYSRHIAAYTKMYLLLKKHGLEAGHFTENHLAAVCQQGKNLMDNVLSEINKFASSDIPDLILNNFREGEKEKSASILPAYFDTMPLRIKIANENPEPWSLNGKRVVIAPACHLSRNLLSDSDIRESNILGILDRDTILQGKSIDGITIHGYDAIPELDPEVILVASPEQHRADILQTLTRYTDKGTRIAVFNRS